MDYAKGAKYETQGQARSEAERVAPGYLFQSNTEACRAAMDAAVFRPFRLVANFDFTRGDALRAWRWLSYLAPLALDSWHRN